MTSKRLTKIIYFIMTVVVMATAFAFPAYAEGGTVSEAIEGTWSTASGEIKAVVDNVVFPIIDVILAIFFFGKLGLAYFDYRKSGHFEWTGPTILFASLVFMLTAPLYIWTIVGI